MIREIPSVGDWIRDTKPWAFRHLGRERAELFLQHNIIHLDLDIDGSLSLASSSDILSCKVLFRHRHSEVIEGQIEIRGNYRSALPMMGITTTTPPTSIDESYHLILLEDEESLKKQPINHLGKTSASDMFWMEYFSYKTIAMITDCSLDCAICHVHIKSSDINVDTKGILVESFDSIQHRLAPIFNQQENHWLEIGDLNTLRLLEIFIGNLDYSVSVEEQKLTGHNVLLTAFQNTILPIPFDFQFLVFTAQDYDAYRMLNYDEFLNASKSNIQQLFPNIDNLEPLSHLASLVPKVNTLCKQLPITHSIKTNRINFSNELADFIKTYIEEKQGERTCRYQQ